MWAMRFTRPNIDAKGRNHVIVYNWTLVILRYSKYVDCDILKPSRLWLSETLLFDNSEVSASLGTNLGIMLLCRNSKCEDNLQANPCLLDLSKSRLVRVVTEVKSNLRLAFWQKHDYVPIYSLIQ